MRPEIKAVIKKLSDTLDKVEDYIEAENDKDTPNEDRIENLENERDAITEAIEALEGID